MNQRTRPTSIVLLALAGLAMSSSAALAQERRPQQADRQREQQHEAGPEQRPQRAGRPMLSGPQVRDERLPGVESGFSSGGEDMRRSAGQPVPPQVFQRALRSLMAEDAPIEIRLSPEQRERITAHVRAFEQRMGATRRDGQRSRPQIDQAPGKRADRAPGSVTDRRPQRDAGQAERPARQGTDRAGQRRTQRPERQGARGDGSSGGPDRAAERQGRGGPAGQDRRAMARELAGVQQKVWAELSAAQQAHIGKAIEAWRQQADEQRMGQMQERYRRDIGQRFQEMDGQRQRRQGDGDRARDGMPADLGDWFAQLPDDVRQRVEERLAAIPQERREALLARARGMEPEQRRQLIRRLLQSDGAASKPQRGENPPR